MSIGTYEPLSDYIVTYDNDDESKTMSSLEQFKIAIERMFSNTESKEIRVVAAKPKYAKISKTKNKQAI